MKSKIFKKIFEFLKSIIFVLLTFIAFGIIFIFISQFVFQLKLQNDIWSTIFLTVGTSLLMGGVIGCIIEVHEIRVYIVKILSELLINHQYLDKLNEAELRKVSSLAFEKTINKKVDNPKHQWKNCYNQLENKIFPLFSGEIRKKYSKEIEISTLSIDEFEKEIEYKFDEEPSISKITRYKIRTKYDLISPKKETKKIHTLTFSGTAKRIPGLPDKKHIRKISLKVDNKTISNDDKLTIEGNEEEITNILEYKYEYENISHIEYDEISYENCLERTLITRMSLLTKGLEIVIETDNPAIFSESLFAFDPELRRIRRGKNYIIVDYDGYLMPKQGFSFYWIYR